MRWSILGFAGLFGALCLSLLGGGTVACVVGDAGAGGTAAVSSTATSAPSCDMLGQGCDVCQQCAASVACIAELQGCQADDGCQSIAACIDGLQSEGSTDFTTCCGEASAFPVGSPSVLAYEAAAGCVFQSQCLYSCFGKFYACNI